MAADFLAGWSAALCVLFGASGLLAGWRGWDLWCGYAQARRTLAMLAFTLLATGLAIRYGVASFAWITDRWTAPGPFTGWALAERFLETAGAVIYGGVAAWDRCGHRGWLWLLIGHVAVGLLVGLLSSAFGG